MNPSLLHDIGAELTLADGGAVEVTAGADGAQVSLGVNRLRHQSAKAVVILDGTLAAGQTATVDGLEIQTADGEEIAWTAYDSLTYDNGSAELTISDAAPRGILGLDVELAGALEKVRIVGNVTLSAGAADKARLSVIWVLGPRIH